MRRRSALGVSRSEKVKKHCSTGSAVFAISATTAVIELQTITDSIPESAQLFSLELLSATIPGSTQRPVIDSRADEATLVVAASDLPHGRIVFKVSITRILYTVVQQGNNGIVGININCSYLYILMYL